MLRSATIKARALAEAGSRTSSRSASRSRFLSLKKNTESPQSSRLGHNSSDGSLNQHVFRSRPTPFPLPAVAVYYDASCEEDNDGTINKSYDFTIGQDHIVTLPLASTLSSDVSGANPTSFVGGRNSSSGNGTKAYPPPSGVTDHHGNPLNQSTRKGSGGPPRGPHRCPKCGTTTIFSHNEFGNSFYCATCSGWFTAAETMEEDESRMKVCMENRRSELQRNRILTLHCYVIISRAQASNGYGRQQHGHNNTSHPHAPVDSAHYQHNGDMDGEQVAQQVKRMPTPKEVMKGLNEFVIGQKKVKIAISVGVYNHYKRVFVAEAQAAAESKRTASEESSDTSFLPLGGNGSGLQELNLGQYGTATVKDPTANSTTTSAPPIGFMETPEINATNVDETDNNSISNSEFGRDVEDCEIEKSNILLLGPTGSGKTLLVKTLARLIDVPLVIADATCLTQAGYVGEDVESVLLSVRTQ